MCIRDSPIPVEQIELMISRIEQAIQSLSESEVISSKLGELVMDELINIDAVAYVRFASVYRSFADIKSFERELTKMKKQKKSK